MIENTVNQLFCELIGGPHYQLKDQQNRVFVGLLLTYTLDLRKKLHLTNAILKNRGIDESKMFKRLHQLHDLRNVLCHFPFEKGEDRLTCETAFSKKPAISERDDEITYAEFDFYDALASDLYEKLQDLLVRHIQLPIMNCNALWRLRLRRQSVRLTKSCGFQKSPN
jgi:hypothetical protein